jgi:hypothetical protein
VLPRIYPGQDTNGILADIDNADIPEIHKLMFEWVKAFTLDSANLTQSHIDKLIAQGVPVREIVSWANLCATQTWFVMSADGGGIPLEREAVTGSVIGHDRAHYHSSTAVTTPSPPLTSCAGDATCWVPVDEKGYSAIVQWSKNRYGFVPNLLKSLSLSPEFYPRHTLALELLERPQSPTLSARQHAMVRRLVNRLNQGSYLDSTTARLLQIRKGSIDAAETSEQDKVVLGFAEKLVRHAYKVTAADAESFRDSGLDDAAYVDVLNTVSIQTSLDRVANALGVQPDQRELLPVD